MRLTSFFSYIPLFIEMYREEIKLATGTGFTVMKGEDFYLITNRHNVTGKDNFTHQCMRSDYIVPNKIVIHFQSYNNPDELVPITQQILNEYEEPLWFEHPELKESADFVAIKLINLENENIKVFPLNHYQDTPFSFSVTDSVSIVGYPYGLKADGLPIWVTGTIASEPMYNFEGLPIILANCSSRSGMSGSPVIIHKTKGQTAEFENFGFRSIHESTWRFIGIYSGRIATPNKDSSASSELGRIWKAQSIYELIDSIK
ncbi:serine protease [Bacillus cereus]|uniref:S1 family peptidase n=1 Tax=Bacillus cereus TaxID=1396 RepID=UPI00285352C6|nr:serine protease [Bacillus cereus]MDR4986157.1 serine protease [Bacillus cereus]